MDTRGHFHGGGRGFVGLKKQQYKLGAKRHKKKRHKPVAPTSPTCDGCKSWRIAIDAAWSVCVGGTLFAFFVLAAGRKIRNRQTQLQTPNTFVGVCVCRDRPISFTRERRVSGLLTLHDGNLFVLRCLCQPS